MMAINWNPIAVQMDVAAFASVTGAAVLYIWQTYQNRKIKKIVDFHKEVLFDISQHVDPVLISVNQAKNQIQLKDQLGTVTIKDYQEYTDAYNEAKNIIRECTLKALATADEHIIKDFFQAKEKFDLIENRFNSNRQDQKNVLLFLNGPVLIMAKLQKNLLVKTREILVENEIKELREKFINQYLQLEYGIKDLEKEISELNASI